MALLCPTSGITHSIRFPSMSSRSLSRCAAILSPMLTTSAPGAGGRATNSASSTIRSATCAARLSASSAMARIAEPFGMKILAYDVFPQPGLVDLDTLIRESDIITLHAPLTPETKNMIGARELNMMKRDALLINTARGGLADEAALAEALTAGRIGGAGFDVLTVEPPKDGNILLDLRLPNLIITPHVAWASREAMQILADQLIDNVEAFAAGKPQNVVEA